MQNDFPMILLKFKYTFKNQFKSLLQGSLSDISHFLGDKVTL